MNKIKRFAAIAMAVVCMAAPTITAMAETTNFNITVGLGKQDPKSKRTKKAGGSKFENRFYVTITSMTPHAGAVNVWSNALDETVRSSPILARRGSKGIGTFYNGYAEPGKYYYMNSSYALSPSIQVNATGRYTP